MDNDVDMEAWVKLARVLRKLGTINRITHWHAELMNNLWWFEDGDE